MSMDVHLQFGFCQNRQTNWLLIYAYKNVIKKFIIMWWMYHQSNLLLGRFVKANKTNSMRYALLH